MNRPTEKDAEQISLREAGTGDRDFLREMLFETLLSEPDAAEMTREMLDEPDLAWYVDDWGKEGDLGFIANDPTGEPIGAAWARLADENGQGYGFYDYETPEIAIATKPSARGMGIGTMLLEKLIDQARKRYSSLSLSVADGNPAKKLYERHGFETVSTKGGHSLMVLDLV